MMYNKLAKYYDALLYDAEAFDAWFDFFNRHKKSGKTLELASGTGEISLRIAKENDIDVSDISEAMLSKLAKKDQDQLIKNYFKLNLTDLKINKTYDNIICFCDSINYILDYSTLRKTFIEVYKNLSEGGVFMFDMHSQERINEFLNPFIEVGNVLGTDYQWTIYSDNNYIHYHFIFYEDINVEEFHTQYVFDVAKVSDMLKELGFEIKIYTDFTQNGITTGEKYFIVGRKL